MGHGHDQQHDRGIFSGPIRGILRRNENSIIRQPTSMTIADSAASGRRRRVGAETQDERRDDDQADDAGDDVLPPKRRAVMVAMVAPPGHGPGDPRREVSQADGEQLAVRIVPGAGEGIGDEGPHQGVDGADQGRSAPAGPTASGRKSSDGSSITGIGSPTGTGPQLVGAGYEERDDPADPQRRQRRGYETCRYGRPDEEHGQAERREGEVAGAEQNHPSRPASRGAARRSRT